MITASVVKGLNTYDLIIIHIIIKCFFRKVKLVSASSIYLFKVNNGNLFNIDNKDTRTTSYYFGVSILVFNKKMPAGSVFS